MTDLVAGFAASSSYSSFAQATSYSRPHHGHTHTSTSTSFAQEASFSFDAVIADSSPVVSLPFGEGDKSSDDIMDALAQKLEGFLEPFGKKGEELAEIINTALESLADLVENTSVDAAALSIDINFSRIEESYSRGHHGASGVFGGFALEVSVSTAAVDYDPDSSAVISMAGSKVEFSTTQMIEGHRHGVFRRAAPAAQNFPGYNQELADQTKEIVEFLKDTRKQIDAFSRDEEKGFRHHLKDMMKDHSRFNMHA